MIADAKLRKWLNHKPRPSYILCDETRVDAPQSDRGWAEVAEAVELMRPQIIRCFERGGTLLRAKPFEHFFPVEEEEDPASEPKPPPLTSEAATLTHLGSLLSNAYAQASTQQAPLMKHAMDMVERLSQQCAQLQAANDELRAQIAELNVELAEANAELSVPAPESSEGDLVKSFVGGALARQNGAPEPTQPAPAKSAPPKGATT